MHRIMILGVVLAGLVLLSGAAPTPAAAQGGCAMVDLTGSCSQGVVKITWDFLCTSNCRPKVVQVERRCGLEGRYVKIADSVTSPFYDRPPIACNAGWYYRLTYVVECPSGIFTGSKEVGPIYCQ